ncbi:putative disease resistance RPP13-like protein 1 [Argentina anserina]|uniref:putative disease resistance RPP13-like protein 1 n=1 Tax=Argentina anserina TaxID=57926 RepID=UPI0021768EDF|nr:putative disease resistance RPP13-like protein 1 [Potentilla anserina]
MAEIASLVLSTGITSGILQVVIDRVSKFVEQKNNLLTGVDDNLRKLKRTLTDIQARVDDLDKKGHCINKAAADLLEHLQYGFLDAEDLLDKIDLGLGRLACLEVEVSSRNQKIGVDCARRGGKCSVIAIVGIGGIGKTTLAQLVYNDADVDKKFDLKMWVFVSLDYGLYMITKSVLESATGGKDSHLFSLNCVQIELQKILKGKRFLLVLDGVCDENLSDWDQFRLPFGGAKKGSKIMMTTRSEISASIVASTSYRLDPLCC